MKTRTIFSAGLLISFFLPWLELPSFTLSGYSIPLAFHRLADLEKFYNNYSPGFLFLNYLLYLVPAFCIFNITRAIAGYKKIFYVDEFVCGLAGAFIIFFIVTNIKEKSGSIFSIGYYMTVLLSILGVLSNAAVRTGGDERDT